MIRIAESIKLYANGIVKKKLKQQEKKMNLKKELGGVADAVTKIMDEALKGDQHKIDANKNNKIDAHDFKLLRSKKKVEEEAEQIDELSKTTLGSYANKATKDASTSSSASANWAHTSDKAKNPRVKDAAAKYSDEEEARKQKRLAGVGKAVSRLSKEEVELTQDEAEMLASLSQEEFNSLTEEEQDLFIEYFQPLDEISTGAAKNYLKKAVSSSSKLNQKSAKPGEDAAAEHDYSHENDAYETPQFEKFSKRRTGIRKAITKLASAHPDNKKLATHARQAFNSMHNANYRIGMDGAKEHPKDVAHIKKQHAIIHKAVNAMKEAAEQVEEAEIVKTATGMRVYGSSYGDSAKARRDQVKKSIDTAKGPKMKDLSDIEAEKKKKKKMSEMVATYQEQGLKGLFATLVKEEPDNEQFTKEVEAQKAKNAGEGKKAEVAKAAVQAVQNEEYDVLDYNEVNGVRISEIDLEERQMTEPEMKKKEEIVKSMKKGIAGFKERYGSRAKNVMYATATKRAMGEEVEQINEAITHGDYIITHKPYNGTDKQRHVSNDITHAYSTNQKKLGIKHSEDDDEIGPDRHITVKNKKTGEVSHHVATHNNSYKDEGEKQKISIRAHSEVTPHDEKHAKVIKSFLTQKS